MKASTIFWALVCAAAFASALAQQRESKDPPSELGDAARVNPAADMPAWVANPSTVPPGKVGKFDCTFPLNPTAVWDFHSEGSCWEKEGEDGWIRQQTQKIHITKFAACGGREGDSTAIRVCHPSRKAGIASPCASNATGENGCAVCVATPTCH